MQLYAEAIGIFIKILKTLDSIYSELDVYCYLYFQAVFINCKTHIMRYLYIKCSYFMVNTIKRNLNMKHHLLLWIDMDDVVSHLT